MSVFIVSQWYRSKLTPFTFLLLPFSWLFKLIITIRAFLYQRGIFSTFRLSAPVIVVGNITVGGTGKTPCVIWLAHFLKAKGLRPGIVSRGVGGKQLRCPRFVDQDADSSIVGDEAILLARRALCPVVVGIDRVAAGELLLEKTDCNIVISDDGLQHYRLDRDIEIVMIDGDRRFGNEQLLPAGPLREPLQRLASVTFKVAQGKALDGEYGMTLQGDTLFSVRNPAKKCGISAFQDKRVHAVAAIGNPARFFSFLRRAGLHCIEHVFSDHHLFDRFDFEFDVAEPIIMTEKDQVKCIAFATDAMWYLPVEARFDVAFEEELWRKLARFTIT